MATTDFPDATPSNIWVKMHAPAARLFRASPFLRNKTANIGSIADYVDWQYRVFGDKLAFFGRREKLWQELIQYLDPNRPLLVLEFGVAWGYATNWWLRRLSDRDVVIHGFDRFTGNQTGYRQLQHGAFDSGGKPPAIDDPRVHWHIGDVRDTLDSVDLAAARDAQWIVLFDMGFYEPTLFAWEALRSHLRPGDVIYFDEAGMPEEMRVLDEINLPSIGCEPVGASPLALGLVVARTISI